MAKLTVGLDDDVMHRFRLAVMRERRTVSSVVREFVESYPPAERGLVAGDEGGVVAENQTSDGRAQKSAVGDSRTPSEQSSPAASPCKREHLHHTNHGGKPCGECGWPNV